MSAIYSYSLQMLRVAVEMVSVHQSLLFLLLNFNTMMMRKKRKWFTEELSLGHFQIRLLIMSCLVPLPLFLPWLWDDLFLPTPSHLLLQGDTSLQNHHQSSRQRTCLDCLVVICWAVFLHSALLEDHPSWDAKRWERTWVATAALKQTMCFGGWRMLAVVKWNTGSRCWTVRESGSTSGIWFSQKWNQHTEQQYHNFFSFCAFCSRQSLSLVFQTL